MRSNAETDLGLSDFNEYVGKRIDGFESVHEGNGFGERKVEGEMLLEFCDEKELRVGNILWFKRREKKDNI